MVQSVPNTCIIYTFETIKHLVLFLSINYARNICCVAQGSYYLQLKLSISREHTQNCTIAQSSKHKQMDKRNYR